MSDSVVIQRPSSGADQLVLLFHGVGASASDMVPLGASVARAFPQAMVVSVNAPHASMLGRGYEWFSVVGVTEVNRQTRVAQAMPGFAETVSRWQHEAGLGPEHTSLIGFSQGSIMSLASTQLKPGLAARVVAIAGRFVHPPQHKPEGLRLHFIHGEQDPVIDVQHSVQGAQALQARGVPVTLDLLPGLGHGIDARVVLAVNERLRPQAA